MEQEKKKQMIKQWIAISIFIIIVVVIAAIMIKYEVEGDKNMPFNLSKIMIVSTAEGKETKGKAKWNFNIYQNNDIYFYLDKNNSYNGKNNIIKNVIIENINISKTPQLGEVKAYMPNSTSGRLYDYSEDYIIEKRLTYKGAKQSSAQTLEVGNQGGRILISFANMNLSKYSSDKDEVTHNGMLLKEVNVSNEDIQFEVSFDFIIELSECRYKANITLSLPQGNIIQNGTESLEMTDMSNIIFKREK